MNTPRTALEECLRLAELATPPGEWKYSPWHVEEGPSAVLSTDGWAVCHTSSDTTAALIAAAINLLRTHGEALSEALGGTRSVTLSGRELVDAARFACPDDGDQDQLEADIAIQYLKEGHSGAGYYCWYAEYPEEGCILLGEDPGAEGLGE